MHQVQKQDSEQATYQLVISITMGVAEAEVSASSNLYLAVRSTYTRGATRSYQDLPYVGFCLVKLIIEIQDSVRQRAITSSSESDIAIEWSSSNGASRQCCEDRKDGKVSVGTEHITGCADS
jgi:hypothetical protein